MACRVALKKQVLPKFCSPDPGVVGSMLKAILQQKNSLFQKSVQYHKSSQK